MLQPLAEKRVEGLVLGLCQQPRLLNQSVLGAESDIFHTITVCTILVFLNRGAYNVSQLCHHLLQSVCLIPALED